VLPHWPLGQRVLLTDAHVENPPAACAPFLLLSRAEIVATCSVGACGDRDGYGYTGPGSEALSISNSSTGQPGRMWP